MKKLLTLLALAGLSAAAGACGDDSGDDSKDDGKGDAAVKNDAATPPRPVQIDNLAAACKTKADCKGVGEVECLTEFGSEMFGGVQELEGGYCTASCNATAECGTNGGCPIADLLSSPQIATALAAFGGPDALKSLIDSQCIATCTIADGGVGQGSCARADHLCRKLLPEQMGGGQQINITALLGSNPALTKTYCLPDIEINLGDAGVRNDGGAALRLSGLDAGI